MAGGWDGDALAKQMEDVIERQEAAAEARLRKNSSSPEQRAREAGLESLRLSKARITEQLGRASNPAHRRMLESALRTIESQMED